MRNLIISAALVAASLFGIGAQANAEESKAPYVELSNPVPVAVPGKIEVVELFWYGCPHCYAFEPVINPWVDKLPSDVNFVRIPAMFGGPWDAHGQMFLALEAMGVEHRVHAAVFNAIQKEHKRLIDEKEMAEFLATQGVDADKFLATFNSFAVKGQITKAKELAKKYEITGVPTMIVNGKYRFDIGSAGGADQALQLADKLIAKERATTKAVAN
ncbi:thiol:disulfide interchange protein DsbA/DsbL [Pseudomonas mediterranea]|jgi:thiol:disulfide interchange protein DsbA|uniref:Thiol:disulfide interchange protein n=1 Tax=Pseudomonas mediterranea TaxID=183795 RepID=A0AAX2D628_9PSED|nr:thiol:disulfide interchange protein DsbA/DsbL [Pseudomonas mediterranea]KGU82352.1 thiol:disulfide interchange protein [Pseudomonas mediterranea CFBP 5447]MBL0843940.1 thiol:disulfide interchange protein DsbA/DsbL [Pseudomonas mediterranea]MDU9027980.1 thiol:disulfide interchange protein DsbA/DsbL [Pseudomonas mediterranea]UZE01080.1 thiol:disulfide interchange protein DsbA/DsbL [Pseudomonas mediterranea]CAH0135448.1 Thiol:disulfide interchange protein DsbA [Pseudomonas mediterranea]